jgi:glucan endo-1,3-alpha-glucosidase
LTQLQQAYAAAEAASFGLFLSFDMQTSSWDSPAVVDLINQFKDSGAQIKRDGRPLVSTFEGTGWADQWEGVRQQTGGIFLVPDWSSIGPDGLRDKLSIVDGACKCFVERGLTLC